MPQPKDGATAGRDRLPQASNLRGSNPEGAEPRKYEDTVVGTLLVPGPRRAAPLPEGSNVPNSGMTRAGSHWCPDCEQPWTFTDSSIGPRELVPVALRCPECEAALRAAYLEGP